MHLENTLRRALAGTGTAVDFSGTWKNELHSSMVLTQAGGALSGVYTSAVSAGGATAVGDLVGVVDGDLISFTVHWRDFQAITAWVGQLRPHTAPPVFDSLWQMTKQVAEGDEWASINAGADSFTRQ